MFVIIAAVFSARKVAVALALLFALHVAVFGWRSLAAERRFSPDAFNYVTVARNISDGKGFVQSAPGFNQAGFWGEQFAPNFPPQTRHSHSVVYPFAVFAFAEVVRLPHATAAFLLAVLGYFAAMILVFHIARQLWGVSAALLAAAVFPFELRDLFLRPWTETVAVPMMLGGLALLAKNPSAPKIAAAGILSGLAVLTRTAMIPTAIVGAAICAIRREKFYFALFVVVAAIPLLGKFVGDGVRYSVMVEKTAGGLFEIFADFAKAAGDEFAVLAALSALALWRRRKSRGAVFPMNWRDGEAALWLWIAAYPAFLIAAAVVFHFESPAVSRYRDPMEAVMALLFAGLVCRILDGWKKLPVFAAALFAVSMGVGMVRDAKYLAQGRDVSDAARIESSPRLAWTRDNVGADDFVIGEDAMDLPYYFPDAVSDAVSFSPFPFSPHVSELQVGAIVLARCGEFKRALLILRRGRPEKYGDFIGGLLRKDSPPNYSPLADLEDGMVYEMTHCKGAPAGD